MPEETSSSKESSPDPYLTLGLKPGASFEEVQRARDQKLFEIGDDPILRAKIEASFDSLLMDSLKARQLGKVSNEAVNASKKEKSNNEIGGSKLLTRLSGLKFSKKENNDKNILPSLNIPQGMDLITRVSIGFLGIILILISPDESTQIILSLSTIILLISYVKGGRGILRSLGWSVVCLSLGLIFGGILAASMVNTSDHMSIITPSKIQGLISILFIWLGSLF